MASEVGHFETSESLSLDLLGHLRAANAVSVGLMHKAEAQRGLGTRSPTEESPPPMLLLAEGEAILVSAIKTLHTTLAMKRGEPLPYPLTAGHHHRGNKEKKLQHKREDFESFDPTTTAMATMVMDSASWAVRGATGTSSSPRPQASAPLASSYPLLEAMRAAAGLGGDHDKINNSNGGGQENSSSAESSLLVCSEADLQACLALSLNNLACIYRRMEGREGEGLQCLEETAEIETHLYGKPRCSTLLNVCTVLIAIGRADEAVPIAKECVELAKVNRENSTSNTSKFSPPPATADDVDTINSNNIITNANAQQGNEEKEKEVARKGNNQHQHHQVPPPPPEQLTVALHNLSVAQQHSSESSERQAAGSTMRLAYDEALAVLGEHHPTTERIRIKLLGDAANKNISTANPPSSRRPTQTSQGQAHLPFGTSGSSSLRPSPPATASSEARGSTVHNSLRGERKAEEAPRSAALRALNAKSRSLIPDSDLAAAVALAAGSSSRQPTMYKSPSRDRNSGSASNSPARASVSPHLYHQGGPSTSTTGITGSDTHYHHQHPFSDCSNDQYCYSLIDNDNSNNNNKNWDASQKDDYDKEKRNGLGTNEEAEEEEAIGSGERLPMTEGDDLSSSAGVHVDAAHTSQSGPQVLAASSSPLPNPSNPPKLSVLERYNILVKENAPRLNPPLSTAVRRPNTSPRPSREAALLPTTTLLPNSNFTFNFSGPRNSSAQFSSRQRLPKGAAAAMLYNPPPAPPKGLNGGQASDTSNVSRKASNAPQQQQQDGGGPLMIDAMMSQIPEKKSASEKRVEDPSSSTAAAAGETPEGGGGGGLDANKNAKRRPSRASIVVSDLFDQGAKKAEDNVSSSFTPSSRRESAENNRKAADALLLLAQSSSAATKGAAFEYYDSLLSSSSFVRFLSAEKIQSVPIPISFTEVKQEMAAERKRLEELRRVRHRTKAILARGLGGGTDHTVVGLGIPLDSPQQSPRGEYENSEQRSIEGGSKATNGSTTALNGTNKTRPTAVEAYVRNTYRAAKGSVHMNVYDRKADQSHSDASAIPSFTGGEESEPQPPSTATVGTAANAASRPKAAMLSVAARRAQRLQEEAAEEQRLRGQRKRIDDQLKREAERRHQLQRLAEARRHRAVIAIQRAWREWWRKSGIVRKRAVDSLRGGIGAGVGMGRRLLAGSPRSLRNKSQQLFGGDGGIPRVFPALLRCAQKWLAKTAGRRFVARLLKEKLSTPADVVAVTAQITKIQCAFRCFMARQALARRRANANAVIALRGEYERRHTAASTIQRAYRRLSGRLWVANERLAYILSFVRLMQRMGRGFCGRITVFNKQHNEVVTRYKSAVTIQRNWRGYLGRLRASMARIRLKCDGKEGAERIVRSRAMIEKALADARARREEEDRKMLDDTEPSAIVGSAMLAYARDVDPSPITLELILTIRAEKATRDLLLQREAEESSAKEELRRLEEERWLAGAEERAKEQYKREALERHGGVGGIGERLAREEAVAKEAYHELNARQLEAELRERFYAPNATDAIKLRAVEGHMRDLELATFTENRAATLIQRRVRRWLKLIRIDEAAAYAYKYRRGECEKRLYAKKEIAVAERAALLAARTNIGDLSAPIRADRETLENEAVELSQHVRLRLESKEAVRSAVDRNRDAKVLALMEAQLEERKAQDAAFLRSSASFAGGKFLTARERMRLGATTSSPTLGEEGQPALGVVDIAGSSSSSFSTSARQNEQEDERADNMGSCAV